MSTVGPVHFNYIIHSFITLILCSFGPCVCVRVCGAGKASQLYSHNLCGLFEHARQMQRLPMAIQTYKLPDKIIPR